MQAWLLALFVLIAVCAIGAYYVNNTCSYINDVFEGFDSSGNLTSVLKKIAQAKCNKEYSECLEKGNSNKSCTTTLNLCNIAGQALDTNVSTTSAPGSSTTLSSAAGAIAYAKSKGMAGAERVADLARGSKLLNLQYGNASLYDDDPTTTENTKSVDSQTKDENTLDPKMKILRDRIAKGYKPNAADFKAAQGLGIINEGDDDTISLYSRLADYVALQQKIKPDASPPEKPTTITAKLKSDVGTNAEDGVDDLLSLRSLIRSDVKEAVREELDAIDNEYEIRYD
jgi:hypothetical protein